VGKILVAGVLFCLRSLEFARHLVCLFALLCSSVGSPAGVNGRRNPGALS
jgi:hypothetical protein